MIISGENRSAQKPIPLPLYPIQIPSRLVGSIPAQFVWDLWWTEWHSTGFPQST
jgi:hypothetical protein